MDLRSLGLIEKYIDGNSHHVSNVPGNDVVMKRGNVTLEISLAGEMVVSNGWYTRWVTFYVHKPMWASDGRICNQAIKKRLDRISEAWYNLNVQ